MAETAPSRDCVRGYFAIHFSLDEHRERRIAEPHGGGGDDNSIRNTTIFARCNYHKKEQFHERNNQCTSHFIDGIVGMLITRIGV